MTIEAIIFDADGVIFDSEGLSLFTFCEVVAEHGLSYTVQDCAPLIGVGTKDILAYLKTHHGLELSEREYLEAREAAYERLCERTNGPERIAGIQELLEWMDQAGMPRAVASSGTHRKIQFNLNRTGLTGRFPVIVTGCEVPRGKPAPDIYLEAARRLNTPPERCLVFEDSLHGLRGAAEAGARAVAIEGSHPREQLAKWTDLIFANHHESLAWLDRFAPSLQ